jgi:GDP-D-mannose 3',5'-epimerase
MISFNVLEAARQAGAKRFFYSSSACIYPEHKQVILCRDHRHFASLP